MPAVVFMIRAPRSRRCERSSLHDAIVQRQEDGAARAPCGDVASTRMASKRDDEWRCRYCDAESPWTRKRGPATHPKNRLARSRVRLSASTWATHGSGQVGVRETGLLHARAWRGSHSGHRAAWMMLPQVHGQSAAADANEAHVSQRPRNLAKSRNHSHVVLW